MEDLYDRGKIRAIGISNFYVDRMVDFAAFNRIKPAINQVEIHIFNQQKQMKEYADKYGIRLEAWAPFGEGRKGTFDNEAVAAIGSKYGKTAAQVMLRWHIQRGIVVIPKSTHRERMEENFNVFDFNLSEEDMDALAALDTASSSFFSHQDPAMVEWFVKMVEERKTTNEKKAYNGYFAGRDYGSFRAGGMQQPAGGHGTGYISGCRTGRKQCICGRGNSFRGADDCQAGHVFFRRHDYGTGGRRI